MSTNEASNNVVVVRTSSQLSREKSPMSPTVRIKPAVELVDLHPPVAEQHDDTHETPHAERTSLTIPRVSVNRNRLAKEEALDAEIHGEHGHHGASVCL